AVAGVPRGRISVADESDGDYSLRTVGQIHAVDRSGGCVSGVEDRAVDPAVVSSTGAARQGARDGGFLGYALWVTLKHLLRRKEAEWSATRALAELATRQSADIVLPMTDGREIRLRRITEPTAGQQRLLSQLGIEPAEG